MKKLRLIFLPLFLLVFSTAAYGDYGCHFTFGKLLSTSLNIPGKKISIRFTCRQDLDLLGASFYCGEAVDPPAYKVSFQEDLSGKPSGTVLGTSSITPKSQGWMTLPFNNLPLSAGKVYHMVIEQDTTRGGQHPVGVLDERHFASVVFGENLNSFDPKDENPDAKLNLLLFENGKWKTLDRQPLYALLGSGSKFQGTSYDSQQELPIHGGGTPSDRSDDVLQGECLHPHYGVTATGFAIRVRKQGHPDGPLNYRVYSNNFMQHKTTLAFTGQALLPQQISDKFQWVTFGIKAEDKPQSFPPECRYIVFQTDSGRAVSQDPGCEDCYLLSEVGNSGGLAAAADLSFDGGAHLSREATSIDGGATWMDRFERDANVILLGPVNFSPGLPTPGPIPTPQSLLDPVP